MINLDNIENFELIDNFIIIPILIYQNENLLYANKAALNFLEYSKEELLNKNFYELIHPDYRELVRKRGFKRKEGEEVPSEYELKIITKSGIEKWVLFKAMIRNYKGKPAVIVSSIDITYQVLTNKFLEIAKQNYEKLFNKYNLIIELILDIDFSPETKLEFLLSKLLHTGINLIDEATAGVTFFYKDGKIVFVDSVGHDLKLLRELNLSQEVFFDNGEGVHIINDVDTHSMKKIKDKKTKEIFVKATKHSFEALTFDIYINNKKYCGLTFDITEENKHFSEISKKILTIFYKLSSVLIKFKYLTDELNKQKSYFETIFQSIGEGIIVTDKNLKIIDMNNNASKITGFDLNNIKYKDISLVFTLFDFESSNSIKIFKENIHQFLNRAKRKAILLNKCSKENLISFQVNPIYSKTENNLNNNNVLNNIVKEYKNEKREIIGYLFIFDDIKNIYFMEERLRQSEKIETVGKLAGGIAHDFNNMLGGILSAAEVIKLQFSDNKELVELVDLIISSSKSAKETTSRLLEFSRKTRTDYKINDLHKIIENSISIAKRSINKNVKIEFFPEAFHTNVLSSSSELQNVFFNLFLNAEDAMKDGGTISIRTENEYIFQEQFTTKYLKYKNFNIRDEEYIKIVVSDTGIGIKEEHIDKIFEPYFTTKEKGKGTGLGLASVYGIIQSHNGAITVSSKVNKGTTFEILLPVILDNKKSNYMDNKLISLNKQSSITKTFKGKALIIDDEIVVRKASSEILKTFGFETIIFSNGYDAINWFKKNKKNIKLILLDLIMPEIGGKDTFLKLKKINKNIPIIIMSGYTKDENISMLMSFKNSYFLAKPFTRDEIKALLYKIDFSE